MKEDISEKESLESKIVPEETEEDEKKDSRDEKEKKEKKLRAEIRSLRSETEKLEKKLKEAENKGAEAEDKYLRILAEYDNFRKRSAKEKEVIYGDATADAIQSLLPLLDNLMLASSYGSGDKVIEGVRMILDSLPDVLSKMNISSFGKPGDPFDPNLHNAVMRVSDENLEEGTVASVLQCGYKYGDKVIRHAMVSVVSNET
ncbi:MAG: nucleotide exchange factor GrpE [Clostridia bacterium]|nr:nucleotide exchange factor GrpE [Clostridia bacterium]